MFKYLPQNNCPSKIITFQAASILKSSICHSLLAQKNTHPFSSDSVDKCGKGSMDTILEVTKFNLEFSSGFDLRVTVYFQLLAVFFCLSFTEYNVQVSPPK